jgi:serine/threonine protein kinase
MDADAPSVLSPGTKIAEYVISSVLGRGGFGITYLVNNPSQQREFALKEFFPEGLVTRHGTDIRIKNEHDFRWAMKRFFDEASLLAQFNHSNIISIRRVFQANSTAYLLLDYIKGKTLEQWLRALNSLPTQQELDLITSPLLDALELVHANRVCHLDISPENIMIRTAHPSFLILALRGLKSRNIPSWYRLLSSRADFLRRSNTRPARDTTDLGRIFMLLLPHCIAQYLESAQSRLPRANSEMT